MYIKAIKLTLKQIKNSIALFRMLKQYKETSRLIAKFCVFE